MYKDIQEIIDALSKKYSISPEDIKDMREHSTHIYAGHFFVCPDRAGYGQGGHKWHLICVTDRPVRWVHVYENYSRDRVEQVAGWCETTGPFTHISQMTNNEKFGTRTGFKSFFPDEWVYGGRFFIERVPQTTELYTGPTIQHYNIYGAEDDGRNVILITNIQNDLPRAKRFANLITRWSKPAQQASTEPESINALIEDTQHAISLAKKLVGGEE